MTSNEGPTELHDEIKAAAAEIGNDPDEKLLDKIAKRIDIATPEQTAVRQDRFAIDIPDRYPDRFLAATFTTADGQEVGHQIIETRSAAQIPKEATVLVVCLWEGETDGIAVYLKGNEFKQYLVTFDKPVWRSLLDTAAQIST